MATPPLLIEYEGPFDFEKLYKGTYSFLQSLNYSVQEDQYKYKGSELEIGWSGKRTLDPYVQFAISLSFHFWGIKQVEVSFEGKKEKMTYGRLKITISGELITGYDDTFKSGRWSSSPFVKKLKDFLNKRILNKDLMLLEDKLYYDTVHIQTYIKKVLGMECSESAY